MKYLAFLSYSHADDKAARWLHRALEGYRPPPSLASGGGGRRGSRGLGPIFRDRDELPSTRSLPQAMRQALLDSEFLIVICSPQSAQSSWVNEEIRYFRELGRDDRILCYIVSGDPGADGDAACFPEALLQAGPNGQTVEPVAADARPGADGRRRAMLRIAAGLLGVGFDALHQRDHRRQIRRLSFLSAGATAISAVTIALAINATIARNEADNRRSQADGLIDFMLGDLQERLREIGRLDIYDAVGDKALEYFALQRDGNDSETTLTQRGRNLQQIGEIRMERGQLDLALEAFNESLLIMERLVALDPASPEAEIGLANSHFYVGYVHLQRGETEDARQEFEVVIGIVDEVVASDPDNTEWLIEQAYAYTNLGRVHESEGSLEPALSAYEKVMQINERIVKLEPGNGEWDLELGFAHNNIGKLIVALGRLDDAEGHFRKDLDIKRRFFEANPENNTYREYLATSQFYLGQLLAWRGAFDEADGLIRASRDHYEFLSQIDPERVTWKLTLANVERQLAIVHHALGDDASSMELMDRSVAALRALVDGDTTNSEWRTDLAHSLLVDANLLLQGDDRDRAAESLHGAREEIDSLLGDDRSSAELQELSVRADLLDALAGPELAEARYRRALDTLDAHFAASSNPRILELRLTALLGLGRDGEADRIRASLHDIGFVGSLD